MWRLAREWSFLVSMMPLDLFFGIINIFQRIVDVPVTLIFWLIFCVSGSHIYVRVESQKKFS